MIKLLTLFITANLFSTQNICAQDCSYEKYYKTIDLAKLEYVNNNFKKANILFKVAFESVDFPYGAHLFMALKASVETNDKIQMEKVAIQLARGGVPLKYFKKFEKYRWYEAFHEQFPNYQKYFTDNFDQEFRASYIRLEKYDKEVNNRFHEWRTRKAEHSVDTIIAEMTRVSLEFQRIVQKHGFPSEQNFGYYYKAGSVVELPTFTLMLHIYGRGELLYIEQLNNMACNGHITQYTATTLSTTRGCGNSTGIRENMEACMKNLGRNK